jgi:hypothetical protein
MLEALRCSMVFAAEVFVFMIKKGCVHPIAITFPKCGNDRNKMNPALALF